jgi:hypothetical protein
VSIWLVGLSSLTIARDIADSAVFSPVILPDMTVSCGGADIDERDSQNFPTLVIWRPKETTDGPALTAGLLQTRLRTPAPGRRFVE